MKKTPMIVCIDSLKAFDDATSSYFVSLSGSYRLFFILGSHLFSLRELIHCDIRRHVHNIYRSFSSNSRFFLPIGFVPFGRCPFIATINQSVALVALWFSLKRFFRIQTFRSFHPIVYFVHTKRMACPHWMYVPGIFKERCCVLDITRRHTPDSSPPFLPHEEKMQQYADVILTNSIVAKRDTRFHVVSKDPNKKSTALFSVLKPYL